MKATPRFLALAFALAWLGYVGAANAQTPFPIYTANTTTAVPQPGVVHFLQVINLGQGPGTYVINTVTFTAYFTTSDTQALLLYLYSGVDTSPSATNALTGATLLGSLRGDLPPGSVVPNGYAFSFNPTPPLVVSTDTGSIGVEFYLLTQDLSAYSSTAYGRFTAGAPTVGTAAGYVWNDGNTGIFDGIFTGSEQTRFNMTNANVRMALIGGLLRVNSFSRSGTTATLTIDSYTGINYQLQRATSLTAGDWTNIGSAAAGSNSTALTFTDSNSTNPAAFYRVVAVTPAAGARSGSTMATRAVNDSSR